MSKLPTHVAQLRQLFLEGRVTHRDAYTPFLFDPVKDIVLLIVFAAVLEVARTSGGRLSLTSTFAGMTITERTGVVRKIMLVHGTYPVSVEPMIKNYITEIEQTDGSFPAFEVVVIPCSQYILGRYPAFAPAPILSKRLPGTYHARALFVKPDELFDTHDFAGLVAYLSSELGV